MYVNSFRLMMKACLWLTYFQDSESLDVLKVVDTMMLLGIPVPETTFYLITNQSFGFVSIPYDF